MSAAARVLYEFAEMTRPWDQLPEDECGLWEKAALKIVHAHVSELLGNGKPSEPDPPDLLPRPGYDPTTAEVLRGGQIKAVPFSRGDANA